METKELTTAAMCSLTCGRTLCNFGDVQEAAEWVAGHPIWTHEFASRPLVKNLRLLSLMQYPDLPTPSDAAHVNEKNWREFLDQMEQKFGKTLSVKQGSEQRTESPIESAERMFGKEKVMAVCLDLE